MSDVVVVMPAGFDPSKVTIEVAPEVQSLIAHGATRKTMSDGATKQGDGQPWTPTITVKGGSSGFYTIKVDK